jgi:Icc-related predicted phosphoesterase
MRLWIMSDLHLELTRGWDLPPADARPAYDVMIVAGDLIPQMDRGVAWLRARVGNLQQVIYVQGNHEAYGQDIDRTVEKARIAASGTNIHVLENEAVTIAGVTFIGCALWTDFELFGNAEFAMKIAAEVMNDYRKIRIGGYKRRLRPEHTLAKHRESRDFIERELRKPGAGPRVVVTHHAPHPTGVRRGFERDIVSAAYASDLTGLIVSGAPDVWIYGHSHEYRQDVVGSTRLVTNAKGYGPWAPQQMASDNALFDPHLIVEI